jgi:hypothetical protein
MWEVAIGSITGRIGRMNDTAHYYFITLKISA